jgi:hypothetical protein
MSFILYSQLPEEPGASRSASREAEGTGPLTPRQPAPLLERGANPGRMPSKGRKE